MKNHVWREGRLLQINKKWSALKETQKAWIRQVTLEEHSAYIEKHGKIPIKKQKSEILDKVYDRVNKRKIWIPYHEFKNNIERYVNKLNRKSPLFIPPKPKSHCQKESPTKCELEEFPKEVGERVKGVFIHQIERYIGLTHQRPSNKIRDNEIKQFLRGFNSKQWKKYGVRMKESTSMAMLYEELRTQIFDVKKNIGEIPTIPNKPQRNRLYEQSVVLETDRLILRKITMRDYKELREMLSDPEVMYAWEHTFDTKKEIMDWITRQLQRYEKEFVGYFVALDKESGEVIGQIGLMWNNIQGYRCLELGYILKKSCWGKGFAIEGAKACMDYGFGMFKINKIYATIRPENKPSIAVAERLGMTWEGEYIKKYNDKQMKHLIYTIGINKEVPLI